MDGLKQTMTTRRAFPIETGSEIHYGMYLLDYFAAKAEREKHIK